MRQSILITGAAGAIGTMLRHRLRRPGRRLRLLDREEPTHDLADGEEWVVGDVTDPEPLGRACAGMDAVVHLGGISRERGIGDLLDVNVGGTCRLLEAARDAGVPRVVLASSNHVVGMADLVGAHRPPGEPRDLMPVGAPVRPDTMYGVTKVALEATGRLFAERFGMDVVCLRIGACADRPRGLRHLVFWLSPDDAARLVEAAVAAPAPGFAVVWGVSRNSRGVLSLTEGRVIGYEPQDDAEEYAGELEAEDAGGWDAPDLAKVGGRWAGEPLGRYNAPPDVTA